MCSVGEDMILGRLPLSNNQRQRLRDDCLWTRKVQRATELNLQKLHCPCTKCGDQKLRFVRNVREHLIQNSIHPQCRMWRGPGTQDSSDEEWEQDF